ncbi:MAG: DNA-cytosine methyltransferase [Gemmatimonadaceae bacterium]|nr:DNA-cytosine methyltransferase [Gemmatimonadaceae bacterium]
MGLSQGEVAERVGYSSKTIHRWETGAAKPRRAAFELLASARLPSTDRARNRFRFIDLFAGIGGLRRGFESIGGECVFTSERDKYAQLTYKANFPSDHPVAGDIIPIASETIPAHDVLLAGFPCQPFSLAGVSKKNALGRPHGFACDAQGTLFYEVARILRHHRPKAFLLENVKNLASHDGGRTFRTIRSVLTDELKYHVSWKVLDARGFVPQHRERIFIVGFRDETGFSWDALDMPQASVGPRLRSILHPEDGTELPESPYTDGKGRVAQKYTLTNHLWQYLRDYAAKHRSLGNGFGFGLFGPEDVARTLSARYHKDGSEILVKRGHRQPPRRLTPRECARLMGFDKPGHSGFQIPVSDTQAYRQFGNSVVVPVVEAVARAMRPFILGEPVAADQLTLPLVARTA